MTSLARRDEGMGRAPVTSEASLGPRGDMEWPFWTAVAERSGDTAFQGALVDLTRPHPDKAVSPVVPPSATAVQNADTARAKNLTQLQRPSVS